MQKAEKEYVASSPSILGQLRKISSRDYTMVRAAHRLFISPAHSSQNESFLSSPNE